MFYFLKNKTFISISLLIPVFLFFYNPNIMGLLYYIIILAVVIWQVISFFNSFYVYYQIKFFFYDIRDSSEMRDLIAGRFASKNK